MEPVFTEYPAGLGQSEAHVRIIQYDLGPLSCVVRFQADTCYIGPKEMRATGHGDQASNTTGPAMATIGEEAALPVAQHQAEESKIDGPVFDTSTIKEPTDVSTFTAAYVAPVDKIPRTAVCKSAIPDKNAVGQSVFTASKSEGTDLYIVTRGRGTPQGHIGEIKTKVDYPNSQAEAISGTWLAQLWLIRTPKLTVGRHSHGLVRDIEHHDRAAGGTWKRWEEQRLNQAALRKLIPLLSELRGAVADHSAAAGGCVALFAVFYREEGGIAALRIFESEGGREMPLPEHLIKSLWSVDE